MNKFAVFDIDGTLIRWQLYHAIVQELAARGHLGSDALDTINRSRKVWKHRTHSESFREYEGVLITTYLEGIAGLDVSEYKSVVNSVFEEYRDQVYTYTRDLVHELKQQGYMLFAISGSQQEIIERLAAYYGFDDVVGGKFEQVNGVFTGTFETAFNRKGEVLASLVSKHGVTYDGSIGVGDSESDIAMLEMTERPIAFNPSRGFCDEAKRRKWPIIIERKNVVYKLEANPDGSYRLAD